MIEELKQLLEIVKDLPHLVMWVLAGLLLYKIIFIGSVFGVIRLTITKLYDFGVTYKLKPKIVQYQIDKHLISTSENKDNFISLLEEMKIATGVYIHDSDIRLVRDLIATYKMEKEIARKKREGENEK